MNKWSQWKRALRGLGIPERPRAERLSATGLAAEYGLGSTFTSAGIKDISTSGVYLTTEKHLRTGELITLILREEVQPENSSELRISVQAQVIRQGEDGVGLSFVLPVGMEANLWGVLVRSIVTLTSPEQVADMFRTLRTILFLCRLCPSGAEEAILLFDGQFENERVGRLAKIALAAENALASEPEFDRRRAHPKLVGNILRSGSWQPDELITQLWTGLLISSCLVDESDDSNQVFVDLLVHITPELAGIFTYACEQALGLAGETESSRSSSVVVTPEELTALTGVSGASRNAGNVAYLFNLGLIQKLPDVATYVPVEKIDITPTTTGLELYKHCHGDHAKVDRQLLLSAAEQLRDFLPDLNQ
ncbi:MAG: PilZ domain-containing protein [Terracidiphilus sp.]